MATNKFAGKCATCGKWVPAQTGNLTRQGSQWITTHLQCGVAMAPAAAEVEFAPTDEQAAIIAAVLTGATLGVEAFAGAGKTATLRLIAKAIPHLTIGYTAFNKAIVVDGQGKFGSNVSAQTFHKMAKDSLPGALASEFMKRVSAPRMNSGVLATTLGCEAVAYTTPNGKYEVPRTRMAEWTGLTVSRWLTSDRDDVVPADVFKADGIELVLDSEGEPANWTDLRNRLLGYARKMVRDLADPKTSKTMTKQHAHGCYLKAFAMSGLALPFDVLMVDEAQDLDPVMLRIIDNTAKAGVQVILVGDSNQAIYEWRGAVNALALFGARPGVVTLRLTQSFRFGPEIAGVAQVMLSALGCPAPIVGAGQPGTVGTVTDPDAVLCRTNSAVIRFALDSLKAGKKVGVVGGVTEIVRFAEACQELKAGRRTNHADLQAFESWAQVQDYVGTDAGADLKLLVDLIDSVGAEVVLADLARCGDHTTPGVDVVVGTTHKTKGLEWKRVALGSDWKTWDADNEYSQSDLRVLYVACTRAKTMLDTGAVFGKR